MGALREELESDGLVLPDYKRSNLTIAKQLAEGKGDLIGEKSKKIFLLMDGFGYNIFDKIITPNNIHSKMLDNGRVEKITTVFPSTTPAALASMYSGAEPSGHGVLGTVMMLKEIGSVKKILGWSPSMSEYLKETFENLDPLIVFPKPYILEKLKGRAKTVFLAPEAIINGGVLNSMVGTDNKIPYVSFEDMLVKIARLMKEDAYDCIYAYYDATDHMQHVYSPDSEEFKAMVYGILHSFDRILSDSLEHSDYNLVLTADHGHATIRGTDTIHIGYGSKMMDYLSVPPWNEPRLRVLAAMPGNEAKLEDYFDKTYGDSGRIVNSDEAIRAGLFGSDKVGDSIRSRFGTHIIIPKSNKYFEYDYPGSVKKQRSTFGSHGSLSSDEMHIPVVIF